MSISVSPDLLDVSPLTGKSEALSIWRKKTKNIYRGLFEIDCTGKSSMQCADLVLETVRAEYSPGAWLPFAFGAVLHFSSGAPPRGELEMYIDDRAKRRGTWQWLVAVDHSKREAYGVHMWASGYLTPVFGDVLKQLRMQGYRVSEVKREPSKFWLKFWGRMRALSKLRNGLLALAAAMSFAAVVYAEFIRH